jgi:hypothetical protein
LLKRCFRRVGVAFALERGGVALQVGAAHGLDLIHRHVHSFGLLDHLRVQIRPQRKLVIGFLQFLHQGELESVHGLRGRSVCLGQLFLKIGVGDRREGRGDLLGIELGQSTELRNPHLDVGSGQG